jgi:hypothetical protein
MNTLSVGLACRLSVFAAICCAPIVGQTPVEAVITNVDVSSCTSPHPSIGSFLPTDGKATVFLRFSGPPSGSMSVSWLDPNKSVYGGAGGSWSNINQFTCFVSALPIAGTAAASLPGTWNVRVSLNGTTVVDIPFTIGPVQVRGPATNYDGSFDPIATDCSHFAGWALDRNNAGTPTRVDIAVSGFPTVSTTANEARADLTGVLANHGWNLFNLQLYEDGALHTAHVYYAGTTQDLPGSPRSFPPSGAVSSCTSPGGSSGSTPTVTWVSQPRSSFQNGDVLEGGWQIAGRSRATYSHIHIDTNRANVATDARLCATPTDQGGSDGSYKQSFTISGSGCLISLSPGATVFFAIHASDGNNVDYYSSTLQSTVGTSTPSTGAETLFAGANAQTTEWLGPGQASARDGSGTLHTYHAFATANKPDRTLFNLSVRPDASGSIFQIELPEGFKSSGDKNSGGVLTFTLPFGLTVTNIDAVNATLGNKQPLANPVASFFACEFNAKIQDLLNKVLSKATWGIELLDVDCLKPVVQYALSVPRAGDLCDVVFPIISTVSSDCLSASNNNSLFGDRTLNTHQTRYVAWKPGGSLASSRIQFHLKEAPSDVVALIKQKGITIYSATPTGDILLDNLQ